MANEDMPVLTEDRFAKMIAERQKRARGSVDKKRGAEAQAMKPKLDGRESTKIDANGLTQFNVRLSPDLKDQVVEEKKRSGRSTSDVVTEALLMYFASKRT